MGNAAQWKKIVKVELRMSEDIVSRSMAVAAVRGQSLEEFVAEVLAARTESHKSDWQKIVERERAPKQWVNAIAGR